MVGAQNKVVLSGVANFKLSTPDSMRAKSVDALRALYTGLDHPLSGQAELTLQRRHLPGGQHGDIGHGLGARRIVVQHDELVVRLSRHPRADVRAHLAGRGRRKRGEDR